MVILDCYRQYSASWTFSFGGGMLISKFLNNTRKRRNDSILGVFYTKKFCAFVTPLWLIEMLKFTDQVFFTFAFCPTKPTILNSSSFSNLSAQYILHSPLFSSCIYSKFISENKMPHTFISLWETFETRKFEIRGILDTFPSLNFILENCLYLKCRSAHHPLPKRVCPLLFRFLSFVRYIK